MFSYRLGNTAKAYKIKRFNIMNIDQTWQLLLDYEIATENELHLVTNINGYKIETLESIIYARTGLNSVDQLVEDLEINE